MERPEGQGSIGQGSIGQGSIGQGATGQGTGGTGSIQGEGDYQSAREYRADVQDYLQHANVERAAREAAPRSPEEARELEEAEAAGRSRAKGRSGRTQGGARSLGRAVSQRPVVTAIVVAGALGYLIARTRRQRGTRLSERE